MASMRREAPEERQGPHVFFGFSVTHFSRGDDRSPYADAFGVFRPLSSGFRPMRRTMSLTPIGRPVALAALAVLLWLTCCTSGDGGDAVSGPTPDAPGGGPGDSPGGNSGESGDEGPEPRRDFPDGDPGCGLDRAAFCDTFDDVAVSDLPEGRAGDADPRSYAGERAEVTNYGEEAWTVRFAKTPACRPGLPDEVGPGQDFLVCDGNDQIQSNHLMQIAAEQNYGQAGLRIRQPFDFYEREGRIVFDAEGDIVGMLHGWIAVSITEDPSPAPSFATMGNFENGPIPRSGMEVHFFYGCHQEHQLTVGQVHVFDEFIDHYYEGPEEGCVETQPGALNHFEVRVSRSHLEVYGTDFSTNGVDFDDPVLLYETDLELPFDRGYVHLETHNHATLKYSDGEIDSWVTRWDNVGFDGPVVSDFREYSIPDSLTLALVTEQPSEGVFVTEERTNIGYQLGTVEEGPAQVFTFEDVDTRGVTRAAISLNAHFLLNWDLPNENYALRYRINRGTWVTRGWSEGELTLLQGPYVYNEAGENVREVGEGSAGRFSLLLEVDPAELSDGKNELEIVADQIPQSYPSIVANIDLVLSVQDESP
jgi:hypothetical protein